MKTTAMKISSLIVLSLAVTHCTAAKNTQIPIGATKKSSEAGDKREEANADAQTVTSNANSEVPVVDGKVDPASPAAKKDTTPASEKVAGKASCKAPEGTVDLAKIKEWVAKDRVTNTDPNIKYTYLPLDLIGKPEASIARVGVFKALNHLALANTDIVNGVDVTGNCILYRFNITDYLGAKAAAKWDIIASTRGQLRVIVSPAPQGSLQTFPANDPVAMDRLTFNATQGGIYSAVIDAPDFVDTFNRTFKPDPTILAVSDHKEAIVCGPRQISYQKLPDGRLYAKSGDEFFGVNGKATQFGADQAPIRSSNYRSGNGIVQIASARGGSVAAEAWVEMKNGFIAYYIHGEGNQARTKAEHPFAVDPTNDQQNYDLTTGRSCITCHVNGTQAAHGDHAGQGNWTTQADLDKLYDGTRDKFKVSLGKIVAAMSDDDKVSKDLMGGLREPVFFNVKRIEKGSRGGSSYDSCSQFCGGKFRNSYCKNLANQLNGGAASDPAAAASTSSKSSAADDSSGGLGSGGGGGYGLRAK